MSTQKGKYLAKDLFAPVPIDEKGRKPPKKYYIKRYININDQLHHLSMNRKRDEEPRTPFSAWIPNCYFEKNNPLNYLEVSEKCVCVEGAPDQSCRKCFGLAARRPHPPEYDPKMSYYQNYKTKFDALSNDNNNCGNSYVKTPTRDYYDSRYKGKNNNSTSQTQLEMNNNSFSGDYTAKKQSTFGSIENRAADKFCDYDAEKRLPCCTDNLQDGRQTTCGGVNRSSECCIKYNEQKLLHQSSCCNCKCHCVSVIKDSRHCECGRPLSKESRGSTAASYQAYCNNPEQCCMHRGSSRLGNYPGFVGYPYIDEDGMETEDLPANMVYIAPPIERHGKFGGEWRHLKSGWSNTGVHTMWIDPNQKQIENDLYTCYVPPKKMTYMQLRKARGPYRNPFDSQQKTRLSVQ